MSEYDPNHIRRTILDNILAWATIDDIVREVSAARERDGLKPFHCPIQNVQQVVLQLVEQGTMVTKTGSSMPVYKLERRGVMRRRGAVITALAVISDKTDTQAHVVEKSGASRADLEDMSAHGLISLRDTELGWVVQLNSQALHTVLQRGAEAVVGDKMPPDDDLSTAARESRMQASVDQADQARHDAEHKLELITAWLRKNNVTDLDAVIGRFEHESEQRVTFEFEEEREINDAERILIGKEQATLRTKLADLERKMAPIQAAIKLSKQRLEELVLEQCGRTRIISTRAYTSIDWETNVAITRDYLTERELKREPIPKGTQKPLLPPPTKAEVKVADVPPINVAPPEAPAAPPVDLPTAILRAIGEDALTVEEIVEKCNGGPDVTGEFTGKVKGELNVLSRANAVRRARNGRYSIIAKATPQRDGADAREDADDEEPGPLAPPEKRRRGKKPSGGEVHP